MTSSEAAELGTRAAQDLAALGTEAIGPGLTDAEFDRVEQEYGFEFADDHRAFLAAGLPLNTPLPQIEGVFYSHAEPWPDWRHGDPAALRAALRRPVEGVLFDVEHNRFWDGTWGDRPQDGAEALRVATTHLATVPGLVPVYGHRYLPAGRGGYGHSVLSMWQTDIVCYGIDLVDYIHNEFRKDGIARTDPAWKPRVTVPFWRELV